jgi:hypothetical protein
MEDLIWAVQSIKQDEIRRVSMSSALSTSETINNNDRSDVNDTNARKARNPKKETSTTTTTLVTPRLCDGQPYNYTSFSCAYGLGAKLVLKHDEDDHGSKSGSSHPAQKESGGSGDETHAIMWNDNNKISLLQKRNRLVGNNKTPSDVTSMMLEMLLVDSGGSPTHAAEVEDMMIMSQTPFIATDHENSYRSRRLSIDSAESARQHHHSNDATQQQSTSINPNRQSFEKDMLLTTGNKHGNHNIPGANSQVEFRDVENVITTAATPVVEDEPIFYVGKRIEVHWKMKDGSHEWFSGCVASFLNGGLNAFIHYDDGDKSMINNGTHPRHVGEFHLWRVWYPSGQEPPSDKRTVHNGWKTVKKTNDKRRTNDDSNRSPITTSGGTSISTSTTTYQNKITKTSREKSVAHKSTKKRESKHKIDSHGHPSSLTDRNLNIVDDNTGAVSKAAVGKVTVRDVHCVNIVSNNIKKSKKRMLVDRADKDYKSVNPKIDTDMGNAVPKKKKKKTEGGINTSTKITNTAAKPGKPPVEPARKRERETVELDKIRKRRPMLKKVPTYKFCQRHPPQPIKVPPGGFRSNL